MAKAVAINRSRAFENIVQRLAGEKAFYYNESEKKVFPTIREFLTFCALLGFQNGNRLPIDASLGMEDIQGVTYEDTEALEFIWLIALAETKTVNILQSGNERKCADIFEEFANGGLQIVSNELSSLDEEHWPQKLHELTKGVQSVTQYD